MGRGLGKGSIGFWIMIGVEASYPELVLSLGVRMTTGVYWIEES